MNQPSSKMLVHGCTPHAGLQRRQGSRMQLLTRVHGRHAEGGCGITGQKKGGRGGTGKLGTLRLLLLVQSCCGGHRAVHEPRKGRRCRCRWRMLLLLLV